MYPRLAAVVLVAVLPLLLCLAGLVYEHRRLLLADADDHLLEAARHVAARHDQFVASLEETLTALRGAPPLLGDDRHVCHERLADILSGQPRYSNFAVIVEGGAVFCDARSTTLTRAPADSPALTALATGDFVLGRASVSPTTGIPILPVAMPLYARAAAPRRALVSGVRLDRLGPSLRPGELPPAARMALVDPDGRALVSDFEKFDDPPPWRDLAPAGAVATRRWGGFHLGMARAGRGDFLVVVGVPERVVSAEMNGQLLRGLAVGLGATAAAVAAAVAVADLLVIRPIKRLSAVARRLEDGDLGVTDGIGHRRDALGALARSLVRLARTSATRIDELTDREVEARLAATRDPVTGAANRRGFDGRLDRAIAATRAEASRLCLLVVDLDGFKAVNDTHGHAAGDRVLAVVAARLAAQVRETDWVARLGGDEFAVVLADVHDRRTAFGVADRVVRAVGQPIPGDGGPALNVGASVGLAFFPDDASDPRSLSRAADAALYAAKQAGRGRWQAAGATAAV